MAYKVSIITSLYNCEEFLGQYFDSLESLKNHALIEVMLVHNEPKNAETAIIKHRICGFNNVRHVVVERREGLYATWNRAIRIADGEYLTIWNVDDLRTSAGVASQMQCLDLNPNVGLVYGDYYTFGGQLSIDRPFHEKYFPNKEKMMARFYGSPFMMWRKSLHSQIGFFDEQFKSAGDYDFWVRVVNRVEVRKVDLMLGRFYVGSGISKTGNVNNVERTAVELRYGLYQKVDLIFVALALSNYCLPSISSFGNLTRVESYFPRYLFRISIRTPYIFVSIIRFPFYSAFPKMKKYISLVLKHGFTSTFTTVKQRFIKVG